MEKKNEKNNLTIIVCLLAIIIVILAIVLGFCMGMIVTNKGKEESPTTQKTDTPENPDQKEEKDEFSELSLEDPEVKRLSGFTANKMCGGTSLAINQKDIGAGDLTDKEKTNIILSIYSQEIISTAMNGSYYSLTEKDLHKYFKDISFMDKYKTAGSTTDLIYPVEIKYEDDSFKFTAFGAGCEGIYSGNFLELKNAKKNKKQIILEYNHYYQEGIYNAETEGFELKIYKHKGDTNPIYEGKTWDKNETDLAKCDTYQIIFTIVDEGYRIERIKYIKSIN